ncbi:hypothetical protein [Halobacillus salinus]|uniref:hypothetical protein n=1 Tax=Halobacillus salinus TaxID=192814 RepID=UPI0009A63270|nr:hypothetical protein [Halobacillus salinus]
MDIKFDSIYVNAIEKNSGIFVGPNSQNGWSTQSKENAALGTVVGTANVIHHNVNVIHDEDEIDTPIITEQKTSGKGSS